MPDETTDPIVKLEQVRSLVETDLPDEDLQLLIDDAEAAIVDRYGPHLEPIEVVRDGGTRTLALDRPIDTGAPITITDIIYGRDVELEPDQFTVLNGGLTLYREGARWGRRVTIAYTAVNDVARRARVLVDLVKLAVAYKAMTSERAGDWQGTFPPYEAEREQILSGLDRGRLIV